MSIDTCGMPMFACEHAPCGLHYMRTQRHACLARHGSCAAKTSTGHSERDQTGKARKGGHIRHAGGAVVVQSPAAAALPDRLGRRRGVRGGLAVGGGGSGVDSGRSGRAALELAVGAVCPALGPVVGRVVEPLTARIIGTAVLDLRVCVRADAVVSGCCVRVVLRMCAYMHA